MLVYSVVAVVVIYEFFNAMEYLFDPVVHRICHERRYRWWNERRRRRLESRHLPDYDLIESLERELL